MNSLFSIVTTLYALVLFYFPSIFSRFILSPVVFSTFILLLYLLQLGAAQRSTIKRSHSHSHSDSDTDTDTDSDSVELNSKQSLPQATEEFRDADSDKSSTVTEVKHCEINEPDEKQFFVEWDVRAPLEVIYEEYEGEGAGENDSEAKRESQKNSIRRYASLSLFYPESDSDASSEGDFPGDGDWDSTCFRWEEEDDKEGLIEIALDGKRNNEVDEDNLIEIDFRRRDDVEGTVER